jgi:hypothetical protein
MQELPPATNNSSKRRHEGLMATGLQKWQKFFITCKNIMIFY